MRAATSDVVMSLDDNDFLATLGKLHGCTFTAGAGSNYQYIR